MTITSSNAGELRRIPIDQIDIIVQARPLNQAHVKRLVESIVSDGLKNPIVVYSRSDRFVLGPGGHRLAAFKELQFPDIDAIVREDATDDVIRQEQIIENLQRENMTPMEEAQACEKLLEELQDPEQVAVMIGRNRKWVDQRLSFIRLSPRVHALIEEGRLPLAYAYHIARVTSPEKQEEIAGAVAADKRPGDDMYSDRRPAPWWQVRNLVAQNLRTLEGVSWRLDLPFDNLPACNSCPDNSANQSSLFADEKKKHSECLNAPCYAQKSKLASSSLRKAVNYMGKEELAASSKNAEAAIAAREVPFIDPKAVVKSAKTAAAPSKKTKSESRGMSFRDDNYELTSKYENAVRQWGNDLTTKIAAKLRSNPFAQSMFILLQATPEFDNIPNYYGAEYETRTRKTDKKEVAAETVILQLLEEFKAPSMAALARISDKVRYTGKRQDDSWPIEISLGDGLSAKIREKLCNIYDIQIPPKPTLEQFKPKKQEPAPKAEAAATPAKKKPASKKKAAKKSPKKK